MSPKGTIVRLRIALLALMLVGCTTMHSAYLTNLSTPREGAKPIEADAWKFILLGLSFSEDYAFEAREDLYAQCPKGTVTGVLTTFQTRTFLLFWIDSVRVRGYCVAPETDDASG